MNANGIQGSFFTPPKSTIDWVSTAKSLYNISNFIFRVIEIHSVDYYDKDFYLTTLIIESTSHEPYRILAPGWPLYAVNKKAEWALVERINYISSDPFYFRAAITIKANFPIKANTLMCPLNLYDTCNISNEEIIAEVKNRQENFEILQKIDPSIKVKFRNE